jgi:hypothetical protein
MLALCALFALLGAAAPLDTRPAVIVYPFQASAALSRDVELRIVTVLGNQIALDGRIRVLDPEPDLDRTAYLASARKAGASYYVTGFLTPLGDGASLIEQLVSTQSGAVVFSSSAQITSLGDVSAQGDVMRLAIENRENQGYPTFSQQPAANSSAQSAQAHPASSQAPEANIGGLFHHKKSAPAPSPAPSPSPSPVAAPSASPAP